MPCKTRVITLLAAAMVATAAPAPGPAEAKKSRMHSDEKTHTFRAYVERPVRVRRSPSSRSRALARLRPSTYFGQPEVVIVLWRPLKKWSLIRYSGLGWRRGWVRSDALSTPDLLRTRLVIDRPRFQIRLYRRGKRVFRAPVGVGAGGSPTPRGQFYIRERLVPPSPDGLYGPVAFGISTYSRYRTDWPGGGQVGVHGTDEPELIPGRISNGCVRLHNRHIKRLDRLMPIGTPVLIL